MVRMAAAAAAGRLADGEPDPMFAELGDVDNTVIVVRLAAGGLGTLEKQPRLGLRLRRQHRGDG
jgi:hypothetical protein